MKLWTELRLRDQSVFVEADFHPPEPDAGLNFWQMELLSLTSADGAELSWELSEAELDAIYEAMPNPEEER